MFYVKNVPTWERVIRVVLSIFAFYFAYQNWGQSSIAVAVGVIGAIMAMSGLMGYCPMCAMVGRKLKKVNQ